ncbi:unnamed protein product [Periconia digitata]|uniref:Uncharacterized protein n=1 Tax=Periconia digitata TaxID=1303443 RepID=A0A9W4XXY3_9PLEO|nr:unnamed protein product [Periconia digitata]
MAARSRALLLAPEAFVVWLDRGNAVRKAAWASISGSLGDAGTTKLSPQNAGDAGRLDLSGPDGPIMHQSRRPPPSPALHNSRARIGGLDLLSSLIESEARQLFSCCSIERPSSHALPLIHQLSSTSGARNSDRLNRPVRCPP